MFDNQKWFSCDLSTIQCHVALFYYTEHYLIASGDSCVLCAWYKARQRSLRITTIK